MQSNITFSSRNNPIKPHIFHAKKGDVLIREILTDDEIPAINTFICNLASDTHENLTAKQKELFIKRSLRELRDSIEYDPNTTILAANDSSGKLVGAAGLVSQELFPQVGEIHSLYVSPSFQKQGLGFVMMDTLTNWGKNVFPSIFVCAEKNAVGFYEKAGFDFRPKLKTDPEAHIVEEINSCWDDKDCMRVGSINLKA